jgi:aspartyl-tRNA(Asn)/glutamyl-tRNA(Gln) amidotransferase subunit A
LTLELSQLSARELVARIASGDLSAAEVLDHYFQTIERKKNLNAFCSTAKDQALTIASEIDQRRKRCTSLGALAGLPIAIKDGICTIGLPTTAGSRILSHFVPPYDATVIQRLKQADTIVIGKTNMDEFAMGSSTENSCYGPTLNPWSNEHVAGGSSGGSAAAVAAGLAPAALGSDTGGSIRQPAAFCGITGLKPTYGCVSRFGLIAYASSLDQIGPMARSAEDCALLMNVIAGHDERDSTSAKHHSENYLTNLLNSIKDLRIGVCREHFEEGLDAEVAHTVRTCIDHLAQLGASVVDISMPSSHFAVPAYYVIAPCEASSNLARFDGVRYASRVPANDLEQMYSKTRGQRLGAEVQRRIMLGTFALSSGYYDAYYLRASKVRRLIKDEFDRAWQRCDVIIGPTTPTPPFKLGDHAQNPLAMYLADVYTVSANLAGIPAISFPVGLSTNGLPIGAQLQGPRFSEALLLQIAHQYQLTSHWHFASPKP